MTSTSDVAPGELSLVLGGPFYQLLLRIGVLRPPFGRLKTRLIALTLFTWLPLLVLTAINGDAVGDAIRVPFLRDVEMHARFLVALPCLILAELLVHQRLGPTVHQFLERGIIRPDDQTRYDDIVASTRRLRNSAAIEVMLLLFVLTVGRDLWQGQLALSGDTWYARVEGGARFLTPAGRWLAFVSIPLVQFLMLRWGYRLFLWTRALWLVARLDLHLVPAHPDRAGGLAFLGRSAYAFGPLLFAQGVVLSGLIASRIFYERQTLPDFTMEIVGLLALMMMLVLGPLAIFAPQLWAAKWEGLHDFGLLANRYVREFDRKWLHGDHSPDEPLMGSSDIQSLSDLANSFEIVRSMRVVPFGKETVVYLVVATALPILPLVLTMIPLEELMKKLIGVLL